MQFDSDVYGPDGSRFATIAEAGGKVMLAEVMSPETDVYPPLDVTNGPLTHDIATTSTAPSLTGLTEYKWNSGVLLTQGQNLVAVPSANGPATNDACANVVTKRGNYGSTGIGYPSILDVGFEVGTVRLVVKYWVNNGYYSSSYHEIDLRAEHGGKIKGIKSEPYSHPAGSGGNQYFYKEWRFIPRRQKFHLQLSPNCYLASIFVDDTARIKPLANSPVLLWLPGDSWRDGFGGYNMSQAGTTYPGSSSLLRSNEANGLLRQTGWRGILSAEGGTGWFVGNGGSTDPDFTGDGHGVFLRTGSIDLIYSLFGTKNPILLPAGGYNDGTSYTTNQYRDRIIAQFNKVRAKPNWANILIGAIGIQPRGWTAGGGGTGITDAGVAAAVAALPDKNKLGFISHVADWGIGGIPNTYLGADFLHQLMRGGNEIAKDEASRLAKMSVPAQYILDTLAA